MFKLGFCVYGPDCRYRHTRLAGPPPSPSTVDAAKPREFRAGGRDSMGHEGGRGRGRQVFQVQAFYTKPDKLCWAMARYACSSVLLHWLMLNLSSTLLKALHFQPSLPDWASSCQ